MEVELKRIHPNPLQPRNKKVDVTDLVDSMDSIGLVQSIVIAKNSDGYVIIAGHRRYAAALKLGWTSIDCDIVDPLDEKMSIASIIAENEVRTALTGKELAAGLQGMMDLGWSDIDVQRAAGVSVEQVAAARAITTAKKKLVAKMPEQASLEELAGLAEFDGNDGAYADLLRSVGTDNFEHRLSYHRKERERVAKSEAAEAQLKEDGVRLITREKSWGGGVLRFTDYRMEKAGVTVPNHTTCPGHCATIEYDGAVTFFCDQPGLHGIETNSNTGPKTEDQKVLERYKRAMRTLWRASAPVRQEFVTAKLAGKTNADLLNWSFLWAEKHGVPAFEGFRNDAKAYTKSKAPMVRVQASCVAMAEDSLEKWVTYAGCQGGLSTTQVAYLKALVKMGYKASDHEKAAIAGTKYEIPEAAK